MSSFSDQLADQLNIRWAWEKVRRAASPGEVWFDELELAGFELELELSLESVASELRQGSYRVKPLRPMPYPKKKDSSGKVCVRQMFNVAIRDQVAWTALVNVVGPYVDEKMPPWSYGNRLYRTIWIEDKDGVKRRRIGRYRHANGRLYLPFSQSWPIFRRHVYLSTRAMADDAKKLPASLDERTKEEQELQLQLDERYRCPFVIPSYWQNRRPPRDDRTLFWCSIDLKKFYPSLNLRVVRQNIVEQLPLEWRDEADRLLASMLDFRIDRMDWEHDALKEMGLGRNPRTFSHIPTGLYVAGFLANAGLLKVDFQVAERLKNRNVAHFRYVDDHIVLSYTFRELYEWMCEYIDLLRDSATGARVNIEKVTPTELVPLVSAYRRKQIRIGNDTAVAKAERACRLDPEFPSPLMTKTLALISAIARTDFDLLESAELGALTDQLEHLLLVDIPEAEIPQKTRLSFAAARLSRLVPKSGAF